VVAHECVCFCGVLGCFSEGVTTHIMHDLVDYARL